MRKALLLGGILAFVFVGCVQTGASESERALQTQVAGQATELALLKEQLLRATQEVATSTTAPTRTVPPPPTSTPIPPTLTPIPPTPTPLPPTQTPVIIVATATTPPMPRVFIEISGSGDLVTQNYEWGYCDKAVFYWTGRPLGSGGNLFVDLYKTGTERYESLVIETIYEPFEGQTLQPLSGGLYYFAIYSPEVSWTIRGECQD